MIWHSRHRRSVLYSAWLLGAGLLFWSWAAVYYRSYMDRVHGGIAAQKEGGRAGVAAFFRRYEAEDHTWHYARAVIEEVPRAGYIITPDLPTYMWNDRWARPLNLGFAVAAVAYMLSVPLGRVAGAVAGRAPGGSQSDAEPLHDPSDINQNEAPPPAS